MDVTPRSLILDLMATLPPEGSHAMPVRALVEAGGYFGLAGNSLRVALARLMAQGRVDRDERGRYRQGSAVTSATRVIRGWRRVDAGTRAWSGAWVAVQSRANRSRTEKKQDAQALRLFGFRGFDFGLSLRPDNLPRGIDGIRNSLFDSGLTSSSLVTRMSDLGEEQEARAFALWDIDELKAEYKKTVAALLQSRKSLRHGSDHQAMVETFRVGGRAIRQLVLDPRLPKEMLDSRPRASLVAAMTEYDHFGRAVWAPFMRRHGVAPSRAKASVPFETAAGIYAQDRAVTEAP